MGIVMCILHSCGDTTCATVVHRAAAEADRIDLWQLLTPQTSGPTLAIPTAESLL